MPMNRSVGHALAVTTADGIIHLSMAALSSDTPLVDNALLIAHEAQHVADMRLGMVWGGSACATFEARGYSQQARTYEQLFTDGSSGGQAVYISDDPTEVASKLAWMLSTKPSFTLPPAFVTTFTWFCGKPSLRTPLTRSGVERRTTAPLISYPVDTSLMEDSQDDQS